MDGALDAPQSRRLVAGAAHDGGAWKPRPVVHTRPAEHAKSLTPATRRSSGGARKANGVSNATHDDAKEDAAERARADRKTADDITADQARASACAEDRDANGVGASGGPDSGTATSPADGAETGEAGDIVVPVNQAAASAEEAADSKDGDAEDAQAGPRMGRLLRWAGVGAQGQTSAAQAAKSGGAQPAPGAADPTGQAALAAAAEASRVAAALTEAGENASEAGESASGAAIEAIEPEPVASAAAAAAELDGGAASGFDGQDQAESRPQPQPPAARSSDGTASAVAVAADAARFSLNVGAVTAAYGSAAPGREEPVLPQIVQSIRMQANQGVSEAKVQLRPEHLGALNITLKVENGQVTATIQAEVPAVRHWIESHESSLRQALLDQGLELNRLIVHPDGEASSGEAHDQEAPRRHPRPQSWRDESMTFEVLA